MTEADKILRASDEIADSYGISNYTMGVSWPGEHKVVRHGKVDTLREYADLPEPRYQVGCLVKIFTAIQIMKMRDEELIDIDETVCKYLPELKNGLGESWERISIRHLLTHSSGLPYLLKWHDNNLQTKYLAQALEGVANNHLFQPGMMVSYSSLGYVVLAYLIERIRGKTWEADLEHVLFKPLEIPWAQATMSAQSGDRTTGERSRVILPAEGGALALTIPELLRIGALFTGNAVIQGAPGILSGNSLEEMGNIYLSPPGPMRGTAGTALGWLIRNDDSLYFSGRYDNNVMLRVMPGTPLVLAMVSGNSMAVLMFEDVWRRFICQKPGGIEIKPSEAQGHPVLNDIEGVYQSGSIRYVINKSDDDFRITVEEEAICTSADGRNLTWKPVKSSALDHVTKNYFYASEFDASNDLWFVVDERDNGKFYIWTGMSLYKKYG